jgi:uncharacterized repeat protein (TIGR02543 family)
VDSDFVENYPHDASPSAENGYNYYAAPPQAEEAGVAAFNLSGITYPHLCVPDEFAESLTVPAEAVRSFHPKFVNVYGDYTVGSNAYSAPVTVSFYADGGLPATGETELPYGGALIPPVLSRTGYAFGGWRAGSADGAAIDINNLVLGRNIGCLDLYAAWTANVYNVAFVADGVLLTERAHAYAEILELSAPEKAGFLFAGWYTAENGGGEKLENGAAYLTDGDLTLYAHYTALPPAPSFPFAAVFLPSGIALFAVAAFAVVLYNRKKRAAFAAVPCCAEITACTDTAPEAVAAPSVFTRETATLYGLTNAEYEIAILLLEGMSEIDISERKFVGLETVRSHRKHIYGKLEVKSRFELLARFGGTKNAE